MRPRGDRGEGAGWRAQPKARDVLGLGKGGGDWGTEESYLSLLSLLLPTKVPR